MKVITKNKVLQKMTSSEFRVSHYLLLNPYSKLIKSKTLSLLKSCADTEPVEVSDSTLASRTSANGNEIKKVSEVLEKREVSEVLEKREVSEVLEKREVSEVLEKREVSEVLEETNAKLVSRTSTTFEK